MPKIPKNLSNTHFDLISFSAVLQCRIWTSSALSNGFLKESLKSVSSLPEAYRSLFFDIRLLWKPPDPIFKETWTSWGQNWTILDTLSAYKFNPRTVLTFFHTRLGSHKHTLPSKHAFRSRTRYTRRNTSSCRCSHKHTDIHHIVQARWRKLRSTRIFRILYRKNRSLES